jgi:hypothetical protein
MKKSIMLTGLVAISAFLAGYLVFDQGAPEMNDSSTGGGLHPPPLSNPLRNDTAGNGSIADMFGDPDNVAPPELPI